MKKRLALRWLHLVGAAVLGAFVYSPLQHVAWFALLTQAVVIPALSLTGFWMWKPQWFRWAGVAAKAPSRG